jgi:hypothetical protein
VKKEVELKSGENKINVELNQEKKFRLNIIAYNYEAMAVLENVKLTVN